MTVPGRVPRQQGYTLVELLLAIFIVTALLLPVGAWVTLALRQQPVIQDDLVAVSSQGLLGIHLPNDIQMAAAAAVDGSNDEVEFTDCVGGAGGDGTGVVLVLLVADIEPRKIVYKEAALRDGGPPDPTRRSVWRRECLLNDPLNVSATRATEVLLDVPPGSAVATCPNPGVAAAVCRTIRFRVALDEPFELRATRRVDSASLRFDRTGNRLPVAKIRVLDVEGDGPFTVVLSPDGSEDPDGDIVLYEWAIPTMAYAEGATIIYEDPPRFDPPSPDSGLPLGSPQVIVWQDPGVYFVQLTVTDGEGATATTYKRVEVARSGVTADLAVEPERGMAELTEFTFSAQVDSPPGRNLAYEWLIRSPPPDLFDDDGNPLDPAPVPAPDTQFTTVRSTSAGFSSALPASMVGLVQVSLTVYDVDDPEVRDSVIYPLQLDEPRPTMSPPSLDPDDPDGPFVGAIMASIGGLELQLDASPSTPGAGGGPLGYRWDFGPAGPPVSESSDGIMTTTVPGGGLFTALVTVTDPFGRAARVYRTAEVDAPLQTAPLAVAGIRDISWAEVAGASAYVVHYEFDVCGATASTPVAAGYRTGIMRALVPPSRCSASGPVRARVVAQRSFDGVLVEERPSNWVAVSPELFAVPGGGG